MNRAPLTSSKISDSDEVDLGQRVGDAEVLFVEGQRFSGNLERWRKQEDTTAASNANTPEVSPRTPQVDEVLTSRANFPCSAFPTGVYTRTVTPSEDWLSTKSYSPMTKATR